MANTEQKRNTLFEYALSVVYNVTGANSTGVEHVWQGNVSFADSRTSTLLQLDDDLGWQLQVAFDMPPEEIATGSRAQVEQRITVQL
eukprot:2328312-Rhodomonas_salina.1